MPDLSIICPTILGRENALQAVMQAFKETTPGGAEVIVPQNHPSVGQAWNEGAKKANGDVLLFTIDDAVPRPGWYEAGLSVLEDWVIPSPTLWLPDGTLEGAGTMGGGMFLPLGQERTLCRSAGILLMFRRQWTAVGEFLPIHYYTDDDWTWRFAKLGGTLVNDHAYAFDHLHHHRGRSDMQRRSHMDRMAFLANAAGTALVEVETP